MVVWLRLHINYVRGWQLEIAVIVCWLLLEEFVGWSLLQSHHVFISSLCLQGPGMASAPPAASRAFSCTVCTARWGQLLRHKTGGSNCCWEEHSDGATCQVWHLCVPAAVTQAKPMISPLPVGPVPRAAVSSVRSARAGMVSMFCKDGISARGRRQSSSREGFPRAAKGRKLRDAIRVNTAGKCIYARDGTHEWASIKWRVGTGSRHLWHSMHAFRSWSTPHGNCTCS